MPECPKCNNPMPVVFTDRLDCWKCGKVVYLDRKPKPKEEEMPKLEEKPEPEVRPKRAYRRRAPKLAEQLAAWNSGTPEEAKIEAPSVAPAMRLEFVGPRDAALLQKLRDEAQEMRRTPEDQIKYLLEFWYARKFGEYKEDAA